MDLNQWLSLIKIQRHHVIRGISNLRSHCHLEVLVCWALGIVVKHVLQRSEARLCDHGEAFRARIGVWGADDGGENVRLSVLFSF